MLPNTPSYNNSLIITRFWKLNCVELSSLIALNPCVDWGGKKKGKLGRGGGGGDNGCALLFGYLRRKNGGKEKWPRWKTWTTNFNPPKSRGNNIREKLENNQNFIFIPLCPSMSWLIHNLILPLLVLLSYLLAMCRNFSILPTFSIISLFHHTKQSLIV